MNTTTTFNMPAPRTKTSSKGFDTTTATIRFSPEKPLPTELVTQWCRRVSRRTKHDMEVTESEGESNCGEAA
jgi:hypothetical protein